MAKGLKVLVLAGGPDADRELSLKPGRRITHDTTTLEDRSIVEKLQQG